MDHAIPEGIDTTSSACMARQDIIPGQAENFRHLRVGMHAVEVVRSLLQRLQDGIVAEGRFGHLQ